MKIDVNEDCIDQIIVKELKELRLVMQDPECWESDDVDADIAAVNRILSYYTWEV